MLVPQCPIVPACKTCLCKLLTSFTTTVSVVSRYTQGLKMDKDSAVLYRCVPLLKQTCVLKVHEELGEIC